jgi:uncharacterized phage-associated protein
LEAIPVKDSRDVANFILKLAEENGDSVTPMQLLKLTYIAHGWFYGIHGRPLICDPVEAWQYGPVIPCLYEATKRYRGSAITARIHRWKADDLDECERDIISQVYSVYGKYSGPQLSNMTHAPGTPWYQTYEPGAFGRRISDDLIEEHYRQKAKNVN